jgi:nitric oxide reductase subunit B
MFGVKGNIALAGMLFCCQHLFRKEAWNPKLVRTAFWSLNGGLAGMLFLDLFPVGMYQLMIVFQEGLWFARSQEILTGSVWKILTYARSIGGSIFIVGGVLPLIWFFVSRGRQLNREEVEVEEGEWTVYEKDWAAQEDLPTLVG